LRISDREKRGKTQRSFHVVSFQRDFPGITWCPSNRLTFLEFPLLFAASLRLASNQVLLLSETHALASLADARVGGAQANPLPTVAQTPQLSLIAVRAVVLPNATKTKDSGAGMVRAT
jgi:hypothetical protein